MSEIALHQIVKFYGADKVLESVTFAVEKGEKVGVIGGNGTGKTTIFKIIAASVDYDEGMLAVRKGATLGYLDQQPDYPDYFTVHDVIDTAFADLRVLESEIKQLENAMAEVGQNENVARIMTR